MPLSSKLIVTLILALVYGLGALVMLGAAGFAGEVVGGRDQYSDENEHRRALRKFLVWRIVLPFVTWTLLMVALALAFWF